MRIGLAVATEQALLGDTHAPRTVVFALDVARELNGLTTLVVIMGKHGVWHGGVNAFAPALAPALGCCGASVLVVRLLPLPFTGSYALWLVPTLLLLDPGCAGLVDGLLERSGFVLLTDVLALCDCFFVGLLLAVYIAERRLDNAFVVAVQDRDGPRHRLARLGRRLELGKGCHDATRWFGAMALCLWGDGFQFFFNAMQV